MNLLDFAPAFASNFRDFCNFYSRIVFFDIFSFFIDEEEISRHRSLRAVFVFLKTFRIFSLWCLSNLFASFLLDAFFRRLFLSRLLFFDLFFLLGFLRFGILNDYNFPGLNWI
jgi:hypothetical protein